MGEVVGSGTAWVGRLVNGETLSSRMSGRVEKVPAKFMVPVLRKAKKDFIQDSIPLTLPLPSP